jgi:hypothetical protein
VFLVGKKSFTVLVRLLPDGFNPPLREQCHCFLGGFKLLKISRDVRLGHMDVVALGNTGRSLPDKRANANLSLCCGFRKFWHAPQ